MSKNLYLTTTGPTAGKSAIVLGLMSFLEREIRKVGYFRPIARTGNSGEIETDRSVKLICDVYGLECNPDLMIGVPERQAMDMITAGKYDELLDEILIKYKMNWDFLEPVEFRGSPSETELELINPRGKELARVVKETATVYQKT
jgi:BioD-like phosphotransacetylase family protein